MPMHGPEVRTLQARKANAQRWGKPAAEVQAIERDYAAAKIAEYISRVVDEAPPLSTEQVDRLTGLLRGVGA